MENSTNECYEVKSSDYLIDYLQRVHGRQPFNASYHLETNYGLIHELSNGEVVFLTIGHDGIIFKNKACFKAAVDADEFPIDNPHKNLFELEKERISNINLHVDYYREHLNRILKLNFQEINRESVEAYLKKIVGRTIRKLTTEKDAVALIAVVGQLIINEQGGSWLIEKRYGTYNPYFEPLLLNTDKQVILLSSIVMGKIKWKLALVNDLFSSHLMRNPIDYTFYSEHHSCIELG
jgi:hypothetical protein